MVPPNLIECIDVVFVSRSVKCHASTDQSSQSKVFRLVQFPSLIGLEKVLM